MESLLANSRVEKNVDYCSFLSVEPIEYDLEALIVKRIARILSDSDQNQFTEFYRYNIWHSLQDGQEVHDMFQPVYWLRIEILRVFEIILQIRLCKLEQYREHLVQQALFN